MELAVHSADASGFTRTGWGGRAADKLEALTPEVLFPVMTSINSLRSYSLAKTSIPLTVPDNPWFSLAGTNNWELDAARDAAMREILALPRANVYDDVAQILAEEGLAASSVVHPILQAQGSVVAPFFAGIDTQIGRQLKTIALLIEGRAQTKVRRQLFYAHQWGYDTHGGQPVVHNNLLGDLSQALVAFQAAMNAIGTAPSVTTFTFSEFGRTFKPASNAGTDHGWGTYAMALGGAVKGGAFYGKLPETALDGPDDLGKEGRWIPTTSIETFGATLMRWLGVPEGDLPYVFPNPRRVPGQGSRLHDLARGRAPRALIPRSRDAARPGSVLGCVSSRGPQGSHVDVAYALSAHSPLSRPCSWSCPFSSHPLRTPRSALRSSSTIRSFATTS
jgi:hypothetical protein